MTRTLFVRPSYDDVTGYLYHYSKDLIAKSESRGFTTINKEKLNANRKVITNVIEKNKPDFIMFNGHGAPNIICGHNHEPIIIKDDNHDLLKGKIIYSISCSSASELGEAVGSTNTTFIGYVDDFALGMDTNCQASIHIDELAKLFLEPSNILVESILKGNTAKEATKKARDKMRKNISKLRTDTSPDAADYIPYLYSNYLFLEVKGNEKAKL